MADNKKNELALIQPKELSFVEDNTLNAIQLQHILKRTPAQYVKERPAKGGGKWKYVTGGYVKKCLNLMFGWDWDFEIMSEQVLGGEVVVKGKLTCRCNGRQIVKMQYGNKEIMYKKGTETPLSIGNDMKAAATDALKKCAAEIGIAADIYNAEDFREVAIDTNVITLDDLNELFPKVKGALSEQHLKDAERIIENKEVASYNKLHSILTKTLQDMQ